MTVLYLSVMANNSCRHRHSSPLHYDSEPSVPSTLWSSASLENIILNLTKKYCLLDNTGSRYGTHEDLRSTNEWFGTQDQWFVDHLNSDITCYNQSTFPSTDGMDRLGQSHAKVSPSSTAVASGLVSQKSCPVLSTHSVQNRRNALSKTTQSATETENSDKWLSGISRKYGSAPNLKVSRYETAFGPDNRTVTRVFYQNGMTTDYGHDDDDGESAYDNGISRVRSTNCLYDNTAASQGDTYVPERPLGRSKSSVDVKENARHIFSGADRSNKKLNTSFSSSNLQNPSFAESSDNMNHKWNGNTGISRSVNRKSETCFEANNKSYSSCQQGQELTKQTVQVFPVDNCCSGTKSALQTSSPPEIFNKVASEEQHNTEDHTDLSVQTNNLNTSQCSSCPTQAKTSELSSPSCVIINEDRPTFSPTRKPLAASFESSGRPNYSKHPERPVSSPDGVNGTSLSAHECVQQQRLSCDSTPPKHMTVQSGYGPGYRPSHEIRETGYSVVLDASKKRSVTGSTNLTTLQYAPSCNRVQSACNPAVNHKTSTPYLPHSQDASTSNDLPHISGLSFSNITPFYSMNSHGGKNTHLSSFLTCKLNVFLMLLYR